MLIFMSLHLNLSFYVRYISLHSTCYAIPIPDGELLSWQLAVGGWQLAVGS
ncbi:MAG: hypothetical protein HC803_07190, partial [Saprospiraceae bacterium]|nr:hypothetical protein [Saprospiraceae bacterium]